jgi:hypothetical protein
VREGPPFYAEVWYYGETKVKGYQIIMRLGIVESKHALEFFAASTDMQPITGLLAEFRQEVDRLLEERFSGAVVMKPETDEAARREIARRELMMDSEVERGSEDDGDG